jgi:type 1 glutamine amidotransferase
MNCRFAAVVRPYLVVAVTLICPCISGPTCWGAEADQDSDIAVRRILLIGQTRDHPPGAHQYLAGLRVLEHCLQSVEKIDVQIVQADEPWTDGPDLLKDVDTVVLYLGQGGRWIKNDPSRLSAVERLAQRDTGIVAIHWAIGATEDKYITPYRDIIGGTHCGSDRRYVVSENELIVVDPKHPIMRRVHGLTIHDEWYYQLKFSPQGKVEPLFAAAIDGRRETVAWAFTRESGGRSFGFSGMHFHENWKNESLRRMLVQAVLWSSKLPVPEDLDVSVPAEIYQLKSGE